MTLTLKGRWEMADWQTPTAAGVLSLLAGWLLGSARKEGRSQAIQERDAEDRQRNEREHREIEERLDKRIDATLENFAKSMMGVTEEFREGMKELRAGLSEVRAIAANLAQMQGEQNVTNGTVVTAMKALVDRLEANEQSVRENRAGVAILTELIKKERTA